MLGALQKAYASASWAIPFYKALCSFALALVPGGFLIRAGLTVGQLAIFWKKHEKTVKASMKLIKHVIKDLAAIYETCPKLGMLLLRVALEKSHAAIVKEKEKKGLARLIISNLDTDRWMRDVGDFLGSLLKSALSGGSPGPVAGWLAKKGLKQLAKVAGAAHKIYKTLKLVRKGTNVARGPGLKDPQVLAAKFVKIMGDAGISLNPKESQAIAKEGCLLKPKIMDRFESLHTCSTKLEQLVDKLTKAAENEMILL